MELKEKLKIGFDHMDCQSTICELEKASGQKISSDEIQQAIKDNLIRKYAMIECDVCGSGSEMAYEDISLK